MWGISRALLLRFPILGVRMAEPRCVDCIAAGITQVRPTPFGGPRSPRCATHHRARRKATQRKAREVRWRTLYNLSPEQYDALYEAQGGKCVLCGRATGATRALSVDHDHETGLVRGLLCRPDNDFLGHLRDNPEHAYRVYEYLLAAKNGEPFAVSVIGEVFVNEEKIG